MTNEKEKALSLVEAGTKLGAAAVGGAVTGAITLLAGPYAVGAAVLASVATKSIEILGDMGSRSLSERERTRIGATAAFAITKIKNRIDAGELPRTDGFLGNGTTRSDADELFEGVLLKAKNEHEEKKAPYIANIYSSVTFTDQISIGDANYYLRLGSTLTYRQLCLLALFSNPSLVRTLRAQDFRGAQINSSVESILQEIYEMYQNGLVAMHEPPSKHWTALLGSSDVIPARMVLPTLGEIIVKVMGLTSIPASEQGQLAKILA